MLQDVKVRVTKEIEMIFVLLRKPKSMITEVSVNFDTIGNFGTC